MTVGLCKHHKINLWSCSLAVETVTVDLYNSGRLWLRTEALWGRELPWQPFLDWLSSCDELMQPSTKKTEGHAGRERKSTADESEEADSDVIHQPLLPPSSPGIRAALGYSGQSLFPYKLQRHNASYCIMSSYRWVSDRQCLAYPYFAKSFWSSLFGNSDNSSLGF